MRRVLGRITRHGLRNTASKGPTRELMAVMLSLDNPRARFSRTESRATLFSCLGETLWQLSGSDRLDFIEYYIPKYRVFAELPSTLEVSDGAYGPRLMGQPSEIKNVIDLLRKRPTTRRAVIQLFANRDRDNYDAPCTCSLQFLIRAKSLHLVTHMRSNDAFIGLPHDIFAFTFIQELIARSTGYEVGTYHHAVGSLHLYDANEFDAKRYLSEDWQDDIAMPAMPAGDPWNSLEWLVEVERSVRAGGEIPEVAEDYWLDLAKILAIKRKLMDNDVRSALAVSKTMSSNAYDSFLRGKVRAARARAAAREPKLPGLGDN
jgi:thymidylate synthase